MSEIALPTESPPASSPCAKPRKSREIQFALAEALESRRRIYGAPCITTLADLLEEIGEDTSCSEVAAAIGVRSALKKSIFVPVASKSLRVSCPVCHVQDRDVFFESDEFLYFVFTRREAGKYRGFSIAELPTKDVLITRYHGEFKRTLREMVRAGRLPGWLGHLKTPKSECVFRIEHVVGSEAPDRSTRTNLSQSSSARFGDFASDFEDAFTQIDREDGLRNLVKLSDLRHALPHYDRQGFDSGLNELRRARRFTLNSADGNHVKLSEAEREAGIREAGSLLVYCSRRSGDH